MFELRILKNDNQDAPYAANNPYHIESNKKLLARNTL
jgi:hypothetical protein